MGVLLLIQPTPTPRGVSRAAEPPPPPPINSEKLKPPPPWQ